MSARLVAITRDVGELDDRTCGLIARAGAAQLRYVAADWGGKAWDVEYFADARAVPAGALPLVIRGTAPPGYDGILGDHDLGAGGHARGEVFVHPILENGGTLVDGPNSISATVTHELAEMFGDETAGLWADMPDGRETARELSDGVEGDSFPMTVRGGQRVSVSNWLLPAWFTIGSDATHFDRMGRLTAPFTMSAGGYLIVRKAGRISNVFGDCMPAWKRVAKARKSAVRAARLGLEYQATPAL